MASSKVSPQHEDLISRAPDNVAHKILEVLPIRMAARTSLLSKQWRGNWLSLQCLDFNAEFFEEQKKDDGSYNWQKCSHIISSILLHHNGPVHDFKLFIPEELDKQYLNLSQWLCFLSKNAVKRIKLDNWWDSFRLSSYIFYCSELVYLELDNIGLDLLPTGFSGFPKLQRLVLIIIEFSKEDIFRNLIAKCPVLAMLKLDYCVGTSHIIIEACTLETLIVRGDFESLTFRGARNLKSASLSLDKMEKFDAPYLLASLCQLQCIQFGGKLCKYLSAAEIPRPLPVTFNNLNKLGLADINLGDFHIVNYVFGMIESCPYMKELNILVVESKPRNQHKKIICNGNKRLDHLIDIKISGLTGSNGELMLIKHLLANSVELETFYFMCGNLSTKAESELYKALMGFPRASVKAHLICGSFIIPGSING